MARWLVASLVVLLLGGGIAWFIRGDQTPRTIRIGVNPWPGHEPLFLARDRGLFAAHGLLALGGTIDRSGAIIRSILSNDPTRAQHSAP